MSIVMLPALGGVVFLTPPPKWNAPSSFSVLSVALACNVEDNHT